MKNTHKALADMCVTDVVGDYDAHTLTYHDGHSRTVYCTTVETPFPEGKLIVSVTDTDGYITHANEAFVEMSGFEKSELIGFPHYILRHPDMPAAAFADLWKTVEETGRWKGYVKNLRKDSGFYWVYASVIANKRHDRIVGYTSVRREPSRERINECIELYKTL